MALWLHFGFPMKNATIVATPGSAAGELSSIDSHRLAAITGGCAVCGCDTPAAAGAQDAQAPQQAAGSKGMDKFGQIMNLATTFMGALKK
jgi:hypothetical protein